MLIFWSFDAKIVIAIKIRLIAQPYSVVNFIYFVYFPVHLGNKYK